MALAFITDVRQGPVGPVLRVDTGTNPFFQWRVGSGHRQVDGIDELQGVSYESPVQQRVGLGAFQTAFDVALDPRYLDRRQRFVQVVSYKTPGRRSPAWSPVRVVSNVLDAAVDGAEAMSAAAGTRSPVGQRAVLQPARSVPFCATEQPLSGALFWGDLLAAVDDLAPLARRLLDLARDERVQAGAAELVQLLGPVLRGLVQSAAAPGGQGVQIPTQSVRAMLPGAPRGGARPAAAARSAPPPAPHRGLPRLGAGLAARGPVDPAVLTSRGMDFGVVSGPALLGLLSTLGPMAVQAIGPLLAKAPELLQVVLGEPVKLLTAVAEANRQEELLANQRVQDVLRSGEQHLLLTLLRDIGRTDLAAPSPAPAAAATATATATSLGGRASRHRTAEPGRRVDERVDVALVPPPPLRGQDVARSYYSAGKPLVLHLRLGSASPAPHRPVPHVVAQVRVCAASTGDTLLERRVELAQVWLDSVVDVPLDAAAVSRLPRGVDLTVSVDVTWTGKDGAAYTTPSRALQHLSLVGAYVAVGLGERRGHEVRLSDPSRFRAFWHQIWEGGSPSHRRWELDVTARYYYRLVPGASSNGRMDSRLKPVPARSAHSDSSVRWGGLLKSGLTLAVGELNALLPEAAEAPWSEPELDSLRSEVVARLTSRQATAELRLRGRGDERGSVWVFPVLDLVDVELHRVTAIAASGAVESTERLVRPFLFPLAAVFLGMTTEG